MCAIVTRPDGWVPGSQATPGGGPAQRVGEWPRGLLPTDGPRELTRETTAAQERLRETIREMHESGELQGAAEAVKLTDAQKHEVRRRYGEGQDRKAISAAMGVPITQVHPICLAIERRQRGDSFATRGPAQATKPTTSAAAPERAVQSARPAPATTAERIGLMARENRWRSEADSTVEMLIRKNADYGDSYRAGCESVGQVLYEGAIRMSDKAARLKTLARRLDREGADGRQVADESLVDTLRDLAGYAILMLGEIETAGAA